MPDMFSLVVAFVIGSLAVGRITRLIVDDDYPPVRWLTDKYCDIARGEWVKLVECPWCVAPYVAGIDVLWAFLSELHWSWWFANLWAACAYVASMISVRDLPPDQR